MLRNIKSLLIITFFSLVFTNNVQVEVVEQNEEHIILNYIITDFSITEIDYNDQIFHDVIIHDEPSFIIKDSPKLPHINRSFIIPDLNYSMNVSVQSYDYKVYNDLNILPSKGNPKRNIDINSIPYKKGDIYLENKNFPGDLFTLYDPYVLRDFRAQVLQFNPFQYNPITKDLMVYNNMEVKIEFNKDEEFKYWEHIFLES